MGRPILVTGPYATQLEQEVERRQRLGQESAARKALISKSYHPVRPDVYNTLQVAGRARSLEGGGGVPAWGPSASQLVCSAPRMRLWPPSFWPQLSTANHQVQTLKAFSSGWRRCLVRSWPHHLVGVGLGGGTLGSLHHVCLQNPNQQELEGLVGLTCQGPGVSIHLRTCAAHTQCPCQV